MSLVLFHVNILPARGAFTFATPPNPVGCICFDRLLPWWSPGREFACGKGIVTNAEGAKRMNIWRGLASKLQTNDRMKPEKAT